VPATLQVFQHLNFPGRPPDGQPVHPRRFGQAEAAWSRVSERGEERRTAAALELLAAKTLATLAAPILPELAAHLWRDLGYTTPLSGHRWEERPTWVPAGQMVAGNREPYFPSVHECLETRRQPAA